MAPSPAGTCIWTRGSATDHWPIDPMGNACPFRYCAEIKFPSGAMLPLSHSPAFDGTDLSPVVPYCPPEKQRAFGHHGRVRRLVVSVSATDIVRSPWGVGWFPKDGVSLQCELLPRYNGCRCFRLLVGFATHCASCEPQVSPVTIDGDERSFLTIVPVGA